LYLLFQENKSFGAITICIHPLMYKKQCREQVTFYEDNIWLPFSERLLFAGHGAKTTCAAITVVETCAMLRKDEEGQGEERLRFNIFIVFK
jgi:hypothetical protein